MHHNSFGGRAPPGPTGRVYSAPVSTELVAVFRRWKEGKGGQGMGVVRKDGREGKGKGEEGKGNGGRGGEMRSPQSDF